MLGCWDAESRTRIFGPYQESEMEKIQQLMGCLDLCSGLWHRPCANFTGLPCTATSSQLSGLKSSDLYCAGPAKALEYARATFGPYQESEMAEIQRLMGCLCFVRRPGASPYADLMAPSLWSDVAREFSRQCCGLLGQVWPSGRTSNHTHQQLLTARVVRHGTISCWEAWV